MVKDLSLKANFWFWHGKDVFGKSKGKKSHKNKTDRGWNISHLKSISLWEHYWQLIQGPYRSQNLRDNTIRQPYYSDLGGIMIIWCTGAICQKCQLSWGTRSGKTKFEEDNILTNNFVSICTLRCAAVHNNNSPPWLFIYFHSLFRPKELIYHRCIYFCDMNVME